MRDELTGLSIELQERTRDFLDKYPKGQSWLLFLLYFAKNHWLFEDAYDYEGDCVSMLRVDIDSLLEKKEIFSEETVEELETKKKNGFHYYSFIVHIPEERKGEIKEVWEGLQKANDIEAVCHDNKNAVELHILCLIMIEYFTHISPSELEKELIGDVSGVMRDLLFDSRRSQQSFYQDSRLTDVVVDILDAKEGTVYNPFAGACYYATALDDSVEYHGEVNNDLAYWLGRLNLLIFDRKNAVCEKKEGIGIDYKVTVRSKYDCEPDFWMDESDYIISTPPSEAINLPMEQISVGCLYKDISLENEYLSCSGKAARKKAIGVYSTDVCRCEKNKELIDADLIETVILLNEFEEDCIHIKTLRVIIVVNKEKARKGIVRFIEGPKEYWGKEAIMKLYRQEEQSEYVADITIEEIRKKKYNLNPKEYTISQYIPTPKAGEEIVTLSDVVEPVTQGEGKEPKIDIRDLSDNYLNCDMASEGDADNTVCLLAGFVGGEFRVGRLKDEAAGWARQLFAFKLKGDKVSEDFLLRSIMDDNSRGQARVKSQSHALSLDDFLNLRILVPSREEQDRREKEDVRLSLRDANEKLKKSFEDFRKDMHIKKHAIGQTIFRINGWWSLMQDVRKKNNGHIDNDSTIGIKHKRTVSEILSNLDDAMKQLTQQIYRLDRGNGLVAEEINLGEFVKDYTEHHQSPIFEYEYVGASDSGFMINFPKAALQIIFDNIVSNACSHGFEKREPAKNRIRIEIKSEGTNNVLYISNNGKPLDLQLQESTDNVFAYGISSKDKNSHHYGIGAYEVKNLMRQFEGEAELISEPQMEYTVTYKLTFTSVITAKAI